MATDNLTPQRLRELLHYDPETDTWTRIQSTMRPDLVGKTALAINDKGYNRIKIGARKVYAHRLVWFWHTGEFPRAHIDHIDGNRLNNRIENLREASRAINAQNQRGRHSNNTSGFPGVHYVASRGNFMAKISVGGKRIHLGVFQTAEEGAADYVEAKRRLHPGCTI